MRKAITAAALLALAATGCNTGASGEELGGLKANLTLPDGTVINAITYTITGGPAAITETNSVDVSNSATAQFRVGELPAGAGYNIAIAGTTAGAMPVPCAGSQAFSVTANGETGVSMTLTCGGGVVVQTNTNGDIEVDINVVNAGELTCPVAAGITALPLEVYVGFDIALEGFATSTTGATFGWAGPGGTFSAASALATDYTCTSAGDHTVVFTVSKPGCTDSMMDVVLTCTGAPTGGTGGTAAAGTGGTGAAGTGGTGGSAGPIDGLSAACGSCVVANCTEAVYGFDIAGPCFSGANGPTFEQLCTDAHVCSTLSADNCAQNNIVGPIGCYCGEGVDPAACQAGTTVIGNCQPEWEAATGCAAAGTLAQRAACTLGAFTDLTIASGYANFALTCQLEMCAAECF